MICSKDCPDCREDSLARAYIGAAILVTNPLRDL